MRGASQSVGHTWLYRKGQRSLLGRARRGRAARQRGQHLLAQAPPARESQNGCAQVLRQGEITPSGRGLLTGGRQRAPRCTPTPGGASGTTRPRRMFIASEKKKTSVSSLDANATMPNSKRGTGRPS